MVTSAAQADVIRLDLHRQGLTGVHLWLEPEASNTAPAVALAAALMGPESGADIMAVFPPIILSGTRRRSTGPWNRARPWPRPATWLPSA